MVYHLIESEVKEVETRSLRLQIDDSLRGWSYDKEPVHPPYSALISVSDVAGRYCPCGGQLYLTRVEHKEVPLPKEVKYGSIYHDVIVKVVEEAKKFLYNTGAVHGSELYDYLSNASAGFLNMIISDYVVKDDDKSWLLRNSRKLWLFEAMNISANLNNIMAKRRFPSLDSLVKEVIPFTVEYIVDGSRIGLSENLRVDALSTPPIVFDLKTGEPRNFHRLYTTGYALALESTTGHPVNVGCIVYVRFREDVPVPIIRKDLHVIDETLRMMFLEERDRRMRIVVEGLDPRGGPECMQSCPFREF